MDLMIRLDLIFIVTSMNDQVVQDGTINLQSVVELLRGELRSEATLGVSCAPLSGSETAGCLGVRIGVSDQTRSVSTTTTSRTSIRKEKVRVSLT